MATATTPTSITPTPTTTTPKTTPAPAPTAGTYSGSGGGGDSGSFTLLDFLDANYKPYHTFDKGSNSKNKNIFVVGRPSFPEPAMDSAYELVPVGLVRRVVRRDRPLSTARWTRQSAAAWVTVAQAFAFSNDAKSPSPELEESYYEYRSGYGYGYKSVMGRGGRAATGTVSSRSSDAVAAAEASGVTAMGSSREDVSVAPVVSGGLEQQLMFSILCALAVI